MKSEYLFYVPLIGSFGKRYHGEFSHWWELELARGIVYWWELELDWNFVLLVENQLLQKLLIGFKTNAKL